MMHAAPVAFELLKGKPTKEHADLILEPLQVMINLAVLGFCPIGTKININNNNCKQKYKQNKHPDLEEYYFQIYNL